MAILQALSESDYTFNKADSEKTLDFIAYLTGH